MDPREIDRIAREELVAEGYRPEDLPPVGFDDYFDKPLPVPKITPFPADQLPDGLTDLDITRMAIEELEQEGHDMTAQRKEYGLSVPTFGSEAKAVGGRLFSGFGELAKFGDLASRYVLPGRTGQPSLAPQIDSDIGKIQGFIGSDGSAPETALGKVAGNVAYYLPQAATPGGGIRSAATSALKAAATMGGAASAAEALGAGEAGKDVAAGLGVLGASAAARSLPERLSKSATKFRAYGLGARPSDYVRSVKNQGVEVIENELTVPLDNAVQDVVRRGTFDKAKSAKDFVQANQSAVKKLANDVDGLLAEIDKARGSALTPDDLEFPLASRYIKEKASARDADELMADIDALKEAIQKGKRNTLQGLNKEKQAIYDKVYTEQNKAREVFDKYLAADLRRIIERKASESIPGAGQEVRKLNDQLGNHLEIDNVLLRQLGTEEGTNVLQKLMQWGRTSGGVLWPVVFGAGTGLLGGAPAGAAAAGAAYLTTSKGALSAAKKLESAARGLESVAPSIDGLAQIAAIIGQRNLKENQSPSSAGSNPEAELEIGRYLPQGSAPGGTPKISPKALGQSEQGLSSNEQGSLQLPSRNDVAFSRPSPAQTAFDVEPGQDGLRNIAEILAEQPPIVRAIIDVESAGKPDAVSRKGAQGLMQVMPANLKKFGADGFDPVQNIDAGMRLLAEEIERYQDVRLALAAYNAGSPAVDRAIKKAGSDAWDQIARYLSEETRNYVPAVLKRYATYAG